MIEVHIKNMVCDRCIRSVSGIFEKAGVPPKEVRLGVVGLDHPPMDAQIQQIKIALDAEGFEWLDDQKVKLIEQVKQLILQLVQQDQLDDMKENLSSYLSSRLHRDYHYLSNTFSTVENTTIEQYFILQKIEKVKEWLVYDELTLNEMAFRLGYSSVAHLSGQFKKVTGFTPTQFKQLKDHHRKPLDKVGN
jgi:AraC family transcriptional regulator